MVRISKVNHLDPLFDEKGCYNAFMSLERSAPLKATAVKKRYRQSHTEDEDSMDNEPFLKGDNGISAAFALPAILRQGSDIPSP
jgi:hypothetical protein